MKIFVCVLCAVAVVSSTPLGSNDPLSNVFDDVKSCVDGEDAVSCLKEQALDTVLRLEGSRTLKLFNGVTFLNNGPRKSRSFEPLSDDHSIRKKQVSERLWKSTTDLMETGDIELTFGSEEDDMSESRAINDVDEAEGRGKKKKLKKKLKVLIPLMILAKAKAVALVVLALLVIAASLFKLALLAKVAFIIKIIAIIKALLAAKKHHQEETWEIAPSHGWEPHSEHVSHAEHGHGWEGGWSRSRKEGNNLAYSAYGN